MNDQAFCSQCGAARSPGAGFCSSCGLQFGRPAQAPKSGRNPIVSGIILVLFAIVLVFLVVMFKDGTLPFPL